MVMDSKDFRSKLKNHETPYNPEAWSQMEELLSTLPAQADSTSDKKRWMRLLLAFLALSIAAVLFWHRSELVYSSSELEVNEKGITEKVSIEDGTFKRTMTQADDQTNAEINQLPLNKSSLTVSADPVQDKNSTERNSITQKSSRGEKFVSSVERTNGKRKDAAKQEKTKRLAASNSNNPQDAVIKNKVELSKRSDRNNSSKVSSQVESTSEVIRREGGDSTAQQDKRSSSSDAENQGSALDQPSTNQLLLTEVIMLDVLRREALAGPEREEARLPDNFKVELPKQRRLFYTGSLGISDINSNRGYYLGAGVFWDIDKILGLEPQLSFASAWDINGTSTSFLSSEQELELATWVHLNLWRVEKHKVSLELAPSLVANWSIAKGETLREYRGIKANYKAALSYTFFMPNGNGVGLRGAVSRFDSGFVAVRYFKKF
jgi:hypothetical protein